MSLMLIQPPRLPLDALLQGLPSLARLAYTVGNSFFFAALLQVRTAPATSIDALVCQLSEEIFLIHLLSLGLGNCLLSFLTKKSFRVIRCILQLMYCKYPHMMPLLIPGIFALFYLCLTCFLYFYLPRAGGGLRERARRLCGGTVTVAYCLILRTLCFRAIDTEYFSETFRK